MSVTELVKQAPPLNGIYSGKKADTVNQKPGIDVNSNWKEYQKILFRIAFIFFIAISIPNSAEWYRIVSHIDWTNLHYRDLYDIARFGSGINFFGDKIFGSTLLGYANWITTAIIAFAGAIAWTIVLRARHIKTNNYNRLYYWLRVIVRYRAGIGIIGFGFTKLLPVQMPYPSLGILNTDFGDLTAQKIFWLSVGIVPWYQVFAGIVEVSAGTLLLFRKTTTLGSVLLLGALGDIVYVNFAYDGGVHVYSSYFVLLASFLLIADVPKIYSLFIKEKFTVPFHYYPSFNKKWQNVARLGLKTITLIVFLPLFFYLQYINFRYDPYKQPAVAGVKNLRGNYAVSEFRLNNKVILNSPQDTVRWQEATFENWTTFTFRVNKPTELDLSNGGGDPQRDINRTFEISGVGGGQRVFYYAADEVDKTLYLQDKFKPVPDRRNKAAGVGGDGGSDKNLNNRNEKDPADEDAKDKGKKSKEDNWIPKEALSHIGDETYKIDQKALSTRRIREYKEPLKNENRKRMVLSYETTDGSRVILKGINENKDSIYVVLDRIDRKYALTDSKLTAGKY